MIEQYVWVEQSSLEFWNLWTGEFRVQNLWTAVSNLFLKNMWIEQSGLQFWNLWGGEFGIQSHGLEGPFLFFKHLWIENSSLGCKCTKICCLTQLWVKKWLPKQLLKNIELFSLFHSKCLVQKNILYIFMYMYPHLHKPKNIQIDCLEVLFLLCVMFAQQNKTCSLQLCCGWKKNL